MNAPKSAAGRLLTPDEVASRLSVSKRTVYRLAATGQIPVVRMSRKLLRFDPEKVEKWINESHLRPRPRRRSRARPKHCSPETSCFVPETEVLSARVSCARGRKGG